MVVLTVLVSAPSAIADQSLIMPANLAQLSISPADGVARQLEIKFIAETNAAGLYTIVFTHGQGLDTLGDRAEIHEYLSTGPGEIIRINERVAFNRDGYHLLQANIGFKADEMQRSEIPVCPIQAFHTYIEIENDALMSFSDTPIEKFRGPMVKDDSRGMPVTEEDVYALDGDFPGEINIEITGERNDRDTYTIYVEIFGTLYYDEVASCTGVTRQPVPGALMNLDWDEDNDPLSRYMPHGGMDVQHIGWDRTDEDGDYYFYYYWDDAPHPVSYYTDQIRLTVWRMTSVAFNGDYGSADIFPSSYIVPVTSGMTHVYDRNADFPVNSDDGSILWGLYRVRNFVASDFAWDTDGKVRYYVRPGCGPLHCRPSCTSCGVDVTVNWLGFPGATPFHVVAHEFGHWVDWRADEYMAPGETVSPHYFTTVSNPGFAWREGWAEFVACAASIYYNGSEQTPYVGDYYATEYSYLDHRWNDLPTSGGRENMEGAIALLLLSMWDGGGTRYHSPQGNSYDWSGDNEEVDMLGLTVFDIANSADGFPNAHVDWVEILAQSVLSGAEEANFNSLFGYLIDQSGSGPVSPAPTSFYFIQQKDKVRQIAWTPNSFRSNVYFNAGLSGCARTDYPDDWIDGYRVYRRNGAFTWDGTLSGFTLVGTANGESTLDFSDTSDQDTECSYVIVAYNAGDESIPAERIVFPEPPHASISGLTNVFQGTTNTYTANAYGGTAPYTYTWFYGVGWYPSSWTQIGTGSSVEITAQVDFTVRVEARGANGSVGTVGKKVNVDRRPPIHVHEIPLNLSPSEIPSVLSIGPASPNPFNPVTMISLALPEDRNVRLDIFDITGRMVRTVMNERMSAGTHQIQIDCNDMSSGCYLYRLNAGGDNAQGKLMLLK